MDKREKSQWLSYDFIYDGIRHRSTIKLADDQRGVEMLYFHHDLEINWVKRIRHKGKYMIINIVVKDDWNAMDTLGEVAASAWVCVYDKSRSVVVEQFEPEQWSYVDEEKPSNNLSRTNRPR